MTFVESIKTCLNKYADFNGRATRSEYWWFVLFCFLVSCGLKMLGTTGALLSVVFYLAMFLPVIAAEVRRLHDTNRTGWLILLNLIPIIGWIILLVWKVQKSDPGPNQYDTPTNPPI